MPSSLVLLSILDYFYLNDNGLHGNNVSSWFPEKLAEVDLSDNLFSGPFSWEHRGLAKLEDLYIRNNFFSGTVPTDLAILARVQKLDISVNFFTGTVPVFL